MNGHAIYCGFVRRWTGVGAASPDRGHLRPVLRMRKIPGRVSKGSPLARDCIQSVTCLMENGGIALNCTEFR